MQPVCLTCRSGAGLRRNGFTLTEVAIVMGVVGFSLAAIWLAASVVGARREIDHNSSYVMQISSNIRNLYTGQSAAVYPATVAAQNAARLFPAELVTGAGAGMKVMNAWEGGFINVVFTAAAAGTPTLYDIDLSLPVSDTQKCVNMLQAIPATGQDGAPIASAFFNPASAIVLETGRTPTQIVADIDANGGCSAVGFRFSL